MKRSCHHQSLSLLDGMVYTLLMVLLFFQIVSLKQINMVSYNKDLRGMCMKVKRYPYSQLGDNRYMQRRLFQ